MAVEQLQLLFILFSFNWFNRKQPHAAGGRRAARKALASGRQEQREAGPALPSREDQAAGWRGEVPPHSLSSWGRAPPGSRSWGLAACSDGQVHSGFRVGTGLGPGMSAWTKGPWAP